MIRAGGQIQTVDGLFEQVFAGGVKCAELVDFLDTQLTVGFSLAVDLPMVGFFNAPADCFAFFSCYLLVHQLFLWQCRDFDLDIDAIKQWPGNFATVACNLVWRAMTFAGRMAQIAAWT